MDIPGTTPKIACHMPNIDPATKVVHQKKGPYNAQRVDIVAKEIIHLLQEWFIKKVDYPKWLANVVVVLKKNMHGLAGSLQDLPEGLPSSLEVRPTSGCHYGESST